MSYQAIYADTQDDGTSDLPVSRYTRSHMLRMIGTMFFMATILTIAYPAMRIDHLLEFHTFDFTTDENSTDENSTVIEMADRVVTLRGRYQVYVNEGCIQVGKLFKEKYRTVGRCADAGASICGGIAMYVPEKSLCKCCDQNGFLGGNASENSKLIISEAFVHQELKKIMKDPSLHDKKRNNKASTESVAVTLQIEEGKYGYAYNKYNNVKGYKQLTRSGLNLMLDWIENELEYDSVKYCDRGVGKFPDCGNRDKEGGFCYDHCKSGYNGIDFLCWHNDCEGWGFFTGGCHSYYRGNTRSVLNSCDKGWHMSAGLCYFNCPGGMVNCVTGCARTDGACANTIIDMTLSVVLMVVDIGTAGYGSSASKATKAAAAAVKTSMFSLKKIAKGAKTAADVGSQLNAAAGNFKTEMELYVATAKNDFAALVPSRVNTAVLIDFPKDTPAHRQIAEAWARRLIYTTMKEVNEEWSKQMLSTLDPTGVIGTIHSFNNPKCQDMITKNMPMVELVK